VAQHHTEQEIFDFITGDFRCAWDALAEVPESVAGHRGNFMFALQATILLEWVCRLCVSDTKALHDFSVELEKIDSRYFTQLDDAIRKKEFAFPGIGPDPLKNLLSALWDLIRNGNAHEYQDIIVTLTDGKRWALGLQGAKYGWPLSKLAVSRSSLHHLCYRIDAEGDLILILNSGVLFLDIREAAGKANLLGRGLTIRHLTRPWGRSGYRFDSNQLRHALQRGTHLEL
jgi:hypothetical protein